MIESAYDAFWGSESVDPQRLSVSVPLASRKAIKDVSWLFHADN